jgi:uncharacterized protein (TIGR03435 family)
MPRVTFRIALLVSAGLLKPHVTLAQPADGPRFEVASIKPSPASNTPRTPMNVDPARVAYNGLSPKTLIQLAYRTPGWKISGGPKWLDSDRYDVAATLPPRSSKDQIPAMVQALLGERFQLVIRRETRQQPVYGLTIAKGGPKLKPGDTSEQWSNGAMKGGILRGRLELHQLTMAGLAEVLSSKADRPVIDMTHLDGVFDINLRWTPDDTPGGDPQADGPSLCTALQEQLGLKLEPVRSPVEVLVVVQMEKPSGN